MTRIVDVHAHVFRTPEIGRGYQVGMGTPEPVRDGDVSEVLRLMDEAGIAESVMLMYMPSWPTYKRELQRRSAEEAKALVIDRIRRNNDWGIETARSNAGRLRVMVFSDPNLMTPAEIREEVARGVASGASGGKIVLQALEMKADDSRMWPFYEICQELAVPMLLQSGGNPSWGGDPYGRPKYFAKAMAAFPDLNFILAHVGAGFEDELVELASRFPNCFTDCAGRLAGHGPHEVPKPDELVTLFRRVGVDRVLFGTNYPGSDPVQFVHALEALPLDRSERDAIANGNFDRLFSK